MADKQVKQTYEKDTEADLTNIKTAKVAEQEDVKSGNITGAQTVQAAITADKKDLKKDIREAKRDGIRHPVRRAK